MKRFVWMEISEDNVYRVRREIWKLLGKHGSKVKAILIVLDIERPKEVSGLTARFGVRVGLEEFFSHVYSMGGGRVVGDGGGDKRENRLWVACC